MSFLSRRLAAAFIATAVIGSMAIDDAAFAQAPMVGPAGGVATTTAPSNGEGTPAGGTGTLSSTRVGPAGVAPAPAPMAATPRYAPTPTARRRVRRTRRARRAVAPRPAAEVGTQSQAGTNGSVPPATRRRSLRDDHPASGSDGARPGRQLWVMAAFGFAAGLPLPLSGFTLRQWLTDSGTSLEAIGLTASIGLAYTLKFLWAPVLDQVPPPILSRRRGWLLLIQPALILTTVALAFGDPRTAPVLLVGTAICLAFLSASQDVAIDAWRIETFPERVQGVALAAYIWGYRAALLISGATAIKLVDWFGWRGSLLCMAALMGVGVGATLCAREPVAAASPPARSFVARLRASVVDPFRDFARRPGAAPIIAFVMLFKLGEALAHTMAVPFYRDMGFVRADVAFATGVPGLVASLLGAAAGGWLVIRVGTGRALVLTGFVQMASMALYFALAVSGGNPVILVLKVTLENFAEAMADAAFITYLSSLCSIAFTATQYALLSSLAAVGLRTLGGLSGFLAAAIGWTWFYGLTILAALPAMLIMLHLLRRFPAPVRPRPGQPATIP